MDSKNILKKLDRIDDLPTLPEIAIQINKMLQDYDTSIQDLSVTIEKDQAMVPKILKLVNSAFFGFKSKISDISHAVMLLGFNTVRNAIVSIAIIEAFSVKKNIKGFDIKQFWTHSVAVAITSQYLAAESKLCNSSDAFTAGLLHDIGKIVLLRYFNDLFVKVWNLVNETELSFCDAEKNEISVTHARIGAHLAKKWQLPANLVDTIKYHHKTNRNGNDYGLIMIVHVADIIVNGYLTNPKIKSPAIDPDALKAVKTQIDTLPDWFPGVQEDVNSACRFFLEKV